MIRLPVLLAAMFVTVVLNAQAQSVEEQYVRIYNLIQQADALNGSGQFALALPKYLEAQAALQRIQKFNPEWKPKVVNYRLDYLKDRIEGGALPSTSSQRSAGPSAIPTTIPPSPRSEAAAETNSTAPEAVAALQNDFLRLQAEKTILEAKLKEALTTQPAAADPQELARAQERIQNLLKENELLKTNLEAAKASSQATRDNREIEQLRQSLAESNRKLAEQSARADALLEEQKELQQRLDLATAATNELSALKQSLADSQRRLAEQSALMEKSIGEQSTLQARIERLTATAATADALRAENDILKQQLAQAQTNQATALTAAEARIAALESDRQLGQIEKLALEARLNKALSTPPLPTNAAPRNALARRVRQLEQDRNELQNRLAAATNSASVRASRELTTQVDQLTKEVTGLRARVAVFEARAIPYTAEELALFQTSRPKVVAEDPEPSRKGTRGLPAGSAALVAEAQQHFAAKDYAKAEANYVEILRQDEKNPTALANLATIQMEAGKLNEAENSILQALAADPDDGYNLATLGKIKYQQEKYDDALDALSRAAKVVPRNAEIQNYLGVTLSQKGLRGPAETALRKAIQIDPAYGSAHNNLAVIYATQTPPLLELARWHYQKALAAGHPKNEQLEKLLDRKEASTK